MQLYDIANSILNDNEYGALYLESSNLIQDYGLNQMDILLSYEETQQIFKICRRWKKICKQGKYYQPGLTESNAYFNLVEKPLQKRCTYSLYRPSKRLQLNNTAVQKTRKDSQNQGSKTASRVPEWLKNTE
ncbi:hypothetical protein [Motiliproteus sp. MSK22-1]|uniref:hypothetical protein n=1 Tax=Motiliproteus sp. MSK22-1 TaxID=1897630 RepID=UPI0009778398|nr:hypothetical protein [Motiliproteus sp. MSK22-1]OMH25821.1 hypothetical protein BGP75_25205 [Motiliproteus sp. MSK22-1]